MLPWLGQKLLEGFTRVLPLLWILHHFESSQLLRSSGSADLLGPLPPPPLHVAHWEQPPELQGCRCSLCNVRRDALLSRVSARPLEGMEGGQEQWLSISFMTKSLPRPNIPKPLDFFPYIIQGTFCYPNLIKWGPPRRPRMVSNQVHRGHLQL